MDKVRLFKIRSHFGQETVGGYADIYCKSQSIPNPVLDETGAFLRGGSAGDGDIFHKAFVNAVLADLRGIFLEQADHGAAVPGIKLMIRSIGF